MLVWGTQLFACTIKIHCVCGDPEATSAVSDHCHYPTPPPSETHMAVTLQAGRPRAWGFQWLSVRLVGYPIRATSSHEHPASGVSFRLQSVAELRMGRMGRPVILSSLQAASILVPARQGPLLLSLAHVRLILGSSPELGYLELRVSSIPRAAAGQSWEPEQTTWPLSHCA